MVPLPPTRPKRALALALLLVCVCGRAPSLPPWPPTFRMNDSTIYMPCDATGALPAPFPPARAAAWGWRSFDWTNGMAAWARDAPQSCEEALVSQADATDAVGAGGRSFVYRNVAKGLPWFTLVREKLVDRAFERWFLPWAACKDYDCGDNATANLYHSFLQTPNATGDCGVGVVCAQYFFDLRNASLRAWLASDYILGPTGLGHPSIRGFFFDDLWYRNGPGDMPPGVVPAACNLSAADVADLEAASVLTLAMINNATVRAGGFNWQQLAPIPEYPNTAANAQQNCAPFMARFCGANSSTQSAATLMVLSRPNASAFWPLPFPAQDTAQFLLVRGPFAWLGYGWSSCREPDAFVRPAEFDVDYGEPVGFCAETARGSGIWSREYTKYSVSLDCASFTATLTPKGARDEPPARAPACATADDCELLGECVAGACRCAAGFTGPNCGALALAPAPAPRGAASPYAWPLPGVNASSWGLSSVFDESDGLFHGLAEIACGTLGIMDSGATFIAHMTSPTGAGAWAPLPAQPVFAGTAAFNPAVVRAADGTFVVAFRNGGVVPDGIYCAGNGTAWPAPPSAPALAPAALASGAPLMVAWARAMAGPWSVGNLTITGDWPGVWHSNPSVWPLRRPVGSARWALSYRYNMAPPPRGAAGLASGNGEERIGIALADDFRGPWRFLTNITLGSPLGVNEDPYIWQLPGQDGAAHVLYHNWVDPGGPGPFAGGHHAWGPLDGSAPWRTSTTMAFPLTAALDDGRVLTFARRERPVLNLDAGGAPTELVTGVLVGDGAGAFCATFAQPIAR